MVYFKIKRYMDIILSTIGLIILAPVFLVIIIAIKLDSSGPILFKQKRIGIHKSHFYILKFRTMRIDTPSDIPTHLLKNPDQWITKVGKFLRKTSLDELPQIINIFKGEMSIIGPRPALWNQYDLIEERDKYGANDVPVGLTGWAQINGRDELTIAEKAKLDGEYVKKIGLLMDARCFFGTIFKVLRSEDVIEGENSEICEKEEKVAKKCEPLVSIIVATYRRDASLRKALCSLAEQTYKNFDIVLVSDNADNTWNEKVNAIVKDVKQKYTSIKIKLIINEQNKGSAETRNTGIRAADGEYITFLDDDDIYLPEKVEVQLSAMLEKTADYCITDILLYDDSNKLVDKRIRSYIKHTDKDSLRKYHITHHITGTSVMMFNKKYLLEIGGFAPINIGDEYYLMERAIEGNGKFLYLNGCYIKAYIHKNESGLSSSKSKIEGEEALFIHKKSIFSQIDKKSIRYVKMRHYAVIAFAELRMKNFCKFIFNALYSFACSPVSCIKLFLGVER